MNKNTDQRIHDLEAAGVQWTERLDALEQALHQLQADHHHAQPSPYISPGIAQSLELARKNAITQILGGPRAAAYRNEHLRAITYHEAEAAFKFRFELTRYDQLRMCDKEAALDFWRHWLPPRHLLKRILRANGVPGMGEREREGAASHGY